MTLEVAADPAAPPFSPEHAVLRTEVRAWVAEHIAPHADAWEDAREYPRSLVRAAGDAGLLGWKYETRWGGRGPDLIADVVVTEELARGGSGGVAAGLGATKDLAPYYVARFGDDAQRERWLRPAVAGETVAALGVTEPGAGSDVAGLRARAVRDGDGWRLSGQKVFITNGSRADWVLAAARTSDEGGWRGISLMIVPTDAPGFAVSRIGTLGWRTSQTGLLSFDEVRVPDDHVLGEPGTGFVMIMQSFQWERVALALGGVTAATGDLEACAPWVRRGDRAAYADLVRRLLAQRALTYEVIERLLAGEQPLGLVSGAKWHACDLSVEAGVFRLSLARRHGTEHDVRRAERAVRDARLGPIGGGAREIMADLVARTLGLDG